MLAPEFGDRIVRLSSGRRVSPLSPHPFSKLPRRSLLQIIGASSLNHIEQNLLDFEAGPLEEGVVKR